jgi:hypothetical protein
MCCNRARFEQALLVSNKTLLLVKIQARLGYLSDLSCPTQLVEDYKIVNVLQQDRNVHEHNFMKQFP